MFIRPGEFLGKGRGLINEEKVVTLGNLDVFKECIENKMLDNSPKQISITSDMWELQSAIEGYEYSASVLLDEVTSDNHGHIDFDIHSISTCVEAEIAPSGKTEDGKIILYAKKLPSKTVSGVVTIY